MLQTNGNLATPASWNWSTCNCRHELLNLNYLFITAQSRRSSCPRPLARVTFLFNLICNHPINYLLIAICLFFTFGWLHFDFLVPVSSFQREHLSQQTKVLIDCFDCQHKETTQYPTHCLFISTQVASSTHLNTTEINSIQMNTKLENLESTIFNTDSAHIYKNIIIPSISGQYMLCVFSTAHKMQFFSWTGDGKIKENSLVFFASFRNRFCGHFSRETLSRQKKGNEFKN